MVFEVIVGDMRREIEHGATENVRYACDSHDRLRQVDSEFRIPRQIWRMNFLVHGRVSHVVQARWPAPVETLDGDLPRQPGSETPLKRKDSRTGRLGGNDLFVHEINLRRFQRRLTLLNSYHTGDAAEPCVVQLIRECYLAFKGSLGPKN